MEWFIYIYLTILGVFVGYNLNECDDFKDYGIVTIFSLIWPLIIVWYIICSIIQSIRIKDKWFYIKYTYLKDLKNPNRARPYVDRDIKKGSWLAKKFKEKYNI